MTSDRRQQRVCRLGWVLSGVLALGLAIVGYQFLIRGSVAPSPDGRTAIRVSGAERDLILAEMRSFLGAVQGILNAGLREDFDAVVEQARAVGGAARDGVPPALIGKLPLGFKRLGFSTHEAFDRLALDAAQMRDPSVVTTALAGLLQNCVACHATYRLTTETP